MVGEIDFSDFSLPDLDESDLDERVTSDFNVALRSQTCDSPGFEPAVIYTCLNPNDNDNPYIIVNDGFDAVAFRKSGTAYSMTGVPTADADGIDWDCDGTIEESVTGNINLSRSLLRVPYPDGQYCQDDDADGVFDEDCVDWEDWSGWSDTEILKGREDWSLIPAGRDRVVVSSASGNPSTAYRALICDGQCDDHAAVSLTGAGFQVDSHDHATAVGLEIPSNVVMLPNFELCDGLDNDGDLQVDEGCPDRDGDGVINAFDNCPDQANADQRDSDNDYIGNACATPVVTDLRLEVNPKGVDLLWRAPATENKGYNVYVTDASGKTSLSTILAGDTTFLRFTEPAFGYSIYEVRPVGPNGIEGTGMRVTLGEPPPETVDSTHLLPAWLMLLLD